MKRMLLLIGGLALAIGCAGHNPGRLGSSADASAERPTNTFAIYLTVGPVGREFASNDWLHTQLKSAPVVTDADVVAFDPTNGLMKLRRGSIQRLPDPLNREVPLKGVPFVCVVDGDRVFPGVFWNVVSSLGDPTDAAVVYLSHTPREGFFTFQLIRRAGVSVGPWRDPRFINCLEKLHKLGMVNYP